MRAFRQFDLDHQSLISFENLKQVSRELGALSLLWTMISETRCGLGAYSPAGCMHAPASYVCLVSQVSHCRCRCADRVDTRPSKPSASPPRVRSKFRREADRGCKYSGGAAMMGSSCGGGRGSRGRWRKPLRILVHGKGLEGGGLERRSGGAGVGCASWCA